MQVLVLIYSLRYISHIQGIRELYLVSMTTEELDGVVDYVSSFNHCLYLVSLSRIHVYSHSETGKFRDGVKL